MIFRIIYPSRQGRMLRFIDGSSSACFPAVARPDNPIHSHFTASAQKDAREWAAGIITKSPVHWV
jgi:hypothetical protein